MHTFMAHFASILFANRKRLVFTQKTRRSTPFKHASPLGISWLLSTPTLDHLYYNKTKQNKIKQNKTIQYGNR